MQALAAQAAQRTPTHQENSLCVEIISCENDSTHSEPGEQRKPPKATSCVHLKLIVQTSSIFADTWQVGSFPTCPALWNARLKASLESRTPSPPKHDASILAGRPWWTHLHALADGQVTGGEDVGPAADKHLEHVHRPCWKHAGGGALVLAGRADARQCDINDSE